MTATQTQPAHGSLDGLLSPTMPYHMVWLATNACNARCVHCSSDAAKPLPDELDTAEAKRMFEDLARCGVFDVAISGGEPLVRRDIYDIIEHAVACRVRVGLGSNGSTITREVAQRLKAIGLDRLQISIDGLEPTHDRARRWKGLFRISERAVLRGIEAGLHVHVCFTAHRLNHHDLEGVVEQCITWGVRRFNMSRFVPTGRGDADLDLTPLEWKALVARFDAVRAAYSGRIEFSTHLAQSILNDPALDCRSGFVGCQAGRGQGCIGPQGDVTPCVMLPVRIGNIRGRSLRDVWESSDLIHALHDRSTLGGWCNSCSYIEKCGGCRAVAYSYTGNALAADPRCWLHARENPPIAPRLVAIDIAGAGCE